MTLAGLLELPTTPDLQLQAHHAQLLRTQAGPLPSFLGAGIPCSCVGVAKTGLGPIVDKHSTSQQSHSTSQRSSTKSMGEYSLDLDADAGLIPLRKRYAATQNSSQRMEPLARRSSSQDSNVDTNARRPMLKDSSWGSISSSRKRDLALPKSKDPKPAVARSEAKVRQHQSAQGIDWQSTEITAPRSIDSGLLCAEELQITAPTVHPGLESTVGDACKFLFQTVANLSSRRRSCKGGSQSSENGEEHNSIEPSLNDSTRSLESNLSLPAASGGCPSPGSSNRTISYYMEDELQRSSSGTVSDYLEADSNRVSTGKYSDDREDGVLLMSTSNIQDVEEDELVALSKLEEVDDALERSMAVSKLREHQERKLTAAIRTGELLAGQFAEALRNRDQAERTIHTVNESREHAEGRLAMALKQIKELQDRLSATELVWEESATELVWEKSRSLFHNARVEKLELEHDLALMTTVLGESQKELQTTRGVLLAEGTRAFQLQVELLDMKQKLQSLNPRSLPAKCQMQRAHSGIIQGLSDQCCPPSHNISII